MIRKTGALASVLLVLVLAAACERPAPEPAPAPAYAPGDTISVAGVLVGARCFGLNRANVTADHFEPQDRVRGVGCAAFCLRQGFPVAVLEGGDPQGTVWTLAVAPQLFADYVAGQVRIRGEVQAPGILEPLSIEVQTGDAWARIL